MTTTKVIAAFKRERTTARINGGSYPRAENKIEK